MTLWAASNITCVAGGLTPSIPIATIHRGRRAGRTCRSRQARQLWSLKPSGGRQSSRPTGSCGLRGKPGRPLASNPSGRPRMRYPKPSGKSQQPRNRSFRAPRGLPKAPLPTRGLAGAQESFKGPKNPPQPVWASEPPPGPPESFQGPSRGLAMASEPSQLKPR